MDEQLKAKLQQFKDDAFHDLCKLAEVEESEFAETDTEDCKAQHMLAKVLKYGTFQDTALALHLFINYLHAANQLA